MKKRIVAIAVTLFLCLGRSVQADPNYSLIGAIMGATAGMVIGNNVDGISKEFAVPILAITGGIIGHQYGCYRNDWDRYAPAARRYDYYDNRYDPWDHRHDRDPWDRRHDYPRYYNRRDYTRYDTGYRYVPPRTTRPQYSGPSKTEPQRYVLPDAHPGVSLQKVTIITRSGIRNDVSILKVNDQFIGPQGEVYKQLPTAEELARRYRM